MLIRLIAVASFPLFLSPVFAQNAPCTPGVSGPAGPGFTSKKNAPYSATIRASVEIRLVDGNVIHGSRIIHQYRDSAGRVREDTPEQCFVGTDGQLHFVINVLVQDLSGTRKLWNINGPGSQIATIQHQPAPPRHPGISREVIAEEIAWEKLHRPSEERTQHEELGTRALLSVMATGARDQRTIPAGAQGNDLPMVTTTECWSARDLGLTMFFTTDERGQNKRTTEVIELTLAEPDPSLFDPPKDYRVVDVKIETTERSSTDTP